MKKVVFVVLMALLSCNAIAQKIVVNEVDKFTGQTIIETSAVKTSKPDFDFKLRQVSDSVFLYVSAEHLIQIVDSNSPAKIYFITANNNRLEITGRIEDIKVKESRSGVHWGFGISTGKSKQVSDVILGYPLQNDTFNLLCQEQITDIRISIGPENYDYEVDKFMAKKFNKLFGLLKD